MPILTPNLTILPPPQRRLWSELHTTPEHFTLYGGTALALRLGHRRSIDFDFFSDQSFDPDQLANTVPYLLNAERIQVDVNTLTCRIDRDGPVLISFFAALHLGRVAPPDPVQDTMLHIASLLDLAGTKVAVVQKRAEVKDYLDIDALIEHHVDLPTALAVGQIVYGRSFNPLITLKALSYFGDLPTLPLAVKERLTANVAAVDLSRLPVLTAYAPRIT
ncbi:MAG TPA: hypothetical protein DCS21_02965 [Gammaproteobacteria bacterium]|nr:hypothetical protein [Gammaproteobacteria bacterium]